MTKLVGVRMDSELIDWIDYRARNENRTRSNMIIRIIEEAKTAQTTQIKVAKRIQ